MHATDEEQGHHLIHASLNLQRSPPPTTLHETWGNRLNTDDLLLDSLKVAFGVGTLALAPSLPAVVAIGGAFALVEGMVLVSADLLMPEDQAELLRESMPILSIEGLGTFISVGLVSGNPSAAMTAAKAAKGLSDLTKLRGSPGAASKPSFGLDILDIIAAGETINSHKHGANSLGSEPNLKPDAEETFDIEDMPILPQPKAPKLSPKNEKKEAPSHNGEPGGTMPPLASGDSGGPIFWSDNNSWPGGGGGPLDGQDYDKMLA